MQHTCTNDMAQDKKKYAPLYKDLGGLIGESGAGMDWNIVNCYTVHLLVVE